MKLVFRRGQKYSDANPTINEKDYRLKFMVKMNIIIVEDNFSEGLCCTFFRYENILKAIGLKNFFEW